LSLVFKIFMILYRLCLPGGLLVAVCFVLIRLGVLSNRENSALAFFPAAVFVAGFVLSAVFRRSRIFFALLALALAQAALAWTVPNLPARSSRALAEVISILLPLNLLVIAFLKERGIISPAGRKRLVLVGLQVMGIATLSLPSMGDIASVLRHPFLPESLSSWSRLSQPALLAFLLAGSIMVALLVKRYRAVESGMLWALIPSFIALRLGGSTQLAGMFFATAGLDLIIALLETSYKMAYHDELTQLPSRRALNEALLKLPEAFSIAMLDIDHFKKFNDSYGHEAGDQALRLVASRLARIAGGGRAYRYGGEEFAVLFPGKPADEVFVYLDRMRKIIEQSNFVVRGRDRRTNKAGKSRSFSVKKETNVTVSIGVAASNGTRLTPAEVLRVADHALYRAKARGRNCTVTARVTKNSAAVRTSMSVVSAG
jgi:diguanylate cyclase (GGDEF)-like protein